MIVLKRDLNNRLTFNNGEIEPLKESFPRRDSPVLLLRVTELRKKFEMWEKILTTPITKEIEDIETEKLRKTLRASHMSPSLWLHDWLSEHESYFLSIREQMNEHKFPKDRKRCIADGDYVAESYYDALKYIMRHVKLEIEHDAWPHLSHFSIPNGKANPSFSHFSPIYGKDSPLLDNIVAWEKITGWRYPLARKKEKEIIRDNKRITRERPRILELEDAFRDIKDEAFPYLENTLTVAFRWNWETNKINYSDRSHSNIKLSLKLHSLSRKEQKKYPIPPELRSEFNEDEIVLDKRKGEPKKTTLEEIEKKIEAWKTIERTPLTEKIEDPEINRLRNTLYTLQISPSFWLRSYLASHKHCMYRDIAKSDKQTFNFDQEIDLEYYSAMSRLDRLQNSVTWPHLSHFSTSDDKHVEEFGHFKPLHTYDSDDRAALMYYQIPKWEKVTGLTYPLSEKDLYYSELTLSISCNALDSLLQTLKKFNSEEYRSELLAERAAHERKKEEKEQKELQELRDSDFISAELFFRTISKYGPRVIKKVEDQVSIPHGD